MGRHTKHGGYLIDLDKVRTYVVPEQLKDCKVLPISVIMPEKAF
jgi:large subunit ribosomal protein L41